jgi:hypothetical protein
VADGFGRPWRFRFGAERAFDVGEARRGIARAHGGRRGGGSPRQRTRMRGQAAPPDVAGTSRPARPTDGARRAAARSTRRDAGLTDSREKPGLRRPTSRLTSPPRSVRRVPPRAPPGAASALDGDGARRAGARARGEEAGGEMPGRLSCVQDGRRWRGSRADVGQSGPADDDESTGPPAAQARAWAPSGAASAFDAGAARRAGAEGAAGGKTPLQRTRMRRQTAPPDAAARERAACWRQSRGRRREARARGQARLRFGTCQPRAPPTESSAGPSTQTRSREPAVAVRRVV